jgi:phosphoribosylformylglycinamidine cyclo-ligase
VPPIFEKLRAIGDIPEADYRRTFNLGIGMILVVSKRNVGRAEALLGEKFYRIGEVVASRRERVIYAGR